MPNNRDKANQADVTQRLVNGLAVHGNPETKRWWENYVKGSAPFLGVKMADIRREVHAWYRHHVKGRYDSETQVDLALALFEGRHSEEKLAGTLYLQEILIPAGAVDWERALDRFALLFDEGKIYDWNVCDWVCVKVLAPLIRRHGLPCALCAAVWRTAENLWRARASVVAFVGVADDPAYDDLIRKGSLTLIRRPERFAKTAVGWVLRTKSKHDRDFVRRIIEEAVAHFSPESLKNALKYFGAHERNHYLANARETRLPG